MNEDQISKSINYRYAVCLTMTDKMNNHVFITGGDRGLGLALVKKFIRNGYIVYAGSYLTNWHELPEQKRLYPNQLFILPLDISDDQSVQNAAEDIRQHAQELDILINNAGIYLDEFAGSILKDLNFEDMKRMYDVNALGPLRVTQALMPLLLKGTRKLVVNISSEAGSVGDCWREKEYGYSMSKAALNMQCVILQNHMKAYGVKVLAVHPGWVRSYMLGRFNEEATVEAEDSAEGIYALTVEQTDLNAPMYLDYQGRVLPW